MTIAPDPIAFFDTWRRDYDTMTFEDQMAFYDEVAKWWPLQAGYHAPAVHKALGRTNATHVIEVGGWQGDLAAETLALFPWIESWTNYDLCPWAINHPKTDDPRYHPVLLEGWPWDAALDEGDAFVATHVIEHMRATELQRLVPEMAQYRIVHLEAPIPEAGPMDWTGYAGSHILEAGWSEVDDMFGSRGFVVCQDGQVDGDSGRWPQTSWQTYEPAWYAT